MRKTKEEKLRLADLEAFKAELQLHKDMISNRDIHIEKLSLNLQSTEIQLYKTQNNLIRTERELKALKEALIRAIEYNQGPNQITFTYEPRIANASNTIERRQLNDR